MQRTLATLLAAVDGGGAARVTTLNGQLSACGAGVLQQLQPFTNLHTLRWSVADGINPADVAAGLATLPPSLTSLDLAFITEKRRVQTLTASAALQAIGTAARGGGLTRLQRLTASHAQIVNFEAGPWLLTFGDADLVDQDWLEDLRQLTSLTALQELALPSVRGTLGGERLQPLQALSQLPRLQALNLVNAACGASGLAALARVRPWTRLELNNVDQDLQHRFFNEQDGNDVGAEEDDVGDWTFAALQTVAVQHTTLLQRVVQLAVRSPLLTEVTCCGRPCSVQLCIPAAATVAQAAAELRRLQFLHDRQLLGALSVGGGHTGTPLPPVAELTEAAAQAGLLALPAVEVLQLAYWRHDGSSNHHQHLSWLLGLLPSVRKLVLYDCHTLTDGDVLAALQRHMQQQQLDSGVRPMLVRLLGALPGFTWEGLCAWTAALPAGRHAPLQIDVKAALKDKDMHTEGGGVAGTALTKMLRLAGRGYVTVHTGR